MIKAVARLRWILFAAYAMTGLAALMAATPSGLQIMGLSVDRLSFLPARVTGFPWSLSTFLADDSVTILALLMIAYALNLGIAWVLASAAADQV